MTRTSSWVLVLAVAVSGCGNDTGGTYVNESAGHAGAAEVAGNASAGVGIAHAGGSTDSSQSRPVPPLEPASAAPPVGAVTMPLQPLRQEDSHSEDRIGCNCMFNNRKGLYLSGLDGELMLRTSAGLRFCPVTDAQLQSLGEPGSDITCAGIKMSIRETGTRVVSIESDSSSAPAILSATEDGVTATAEGDWGCAC